MIPEISQEDAAILFWAERFEDAGLKTQEEKAEALKFVLDFFQLMEETQASASSLVKDLEKQVASAAE